MKRTSLLLLTAGLAVTASTHAAIITTVSSAFEQSTTRSGAVTEDFDDIVPGVTGAPFWGAIGTYLPLDFTGISSADQYGGANNTPYYYTYNGGTLIELYSDSTYFGLWASAIDRLNQVIFYDSLFNYLGGAVLSDFNLSGDYLGNLNYNPRLNDGEIYAYVNFDTTEGSLIRYVYIAGGNFESDNHSVVYAVASVPDGDSTLILCDVTFLALFGFGASPRSADIA